MSTSQDSLGILLNNTKKKKRPNSQIKPKKISEIMAQSKPSYLNNINNIVNPNKPHKCALTPTNKTQNPALANELLLPSKSIEFNSKKTLILDLDETLVHSSPTPFENNDIILDVEFDGIIYNIFVLVRPGVENFLKNMSKYFEIVIFTASISRYASPLLDILDKEKNIKFRLYRENCMFINGVYIKELKKLNRNLKDVIIVDNSPIAYAFDSVNGLPIKSWYEDKKDNELFNIQRLLEFLAKTNDVREYISLFVENNEIKYEKAYKIINSKKNISKKNSNNNSYLSLYDFLTNTNNTNKVNNKEIKKFILRNKSLKIDESKIQNNQKNPKNCFRLNSNNKLNYQMSFKNVMEKTNNNNINTLFPLTLAMPNTAKIADDNKKDNITKLNKEKMKFLKKKSNCSNILEFLNKNSLNVEKDKRNNIKKNMFHLNIKTIHKNKKLHISSSSIINKIGFIPYNELKRNSSMKNFHSLNNSCLKMNNRSKSTDIFNSFPNHSKTPKINPNFRNIERSNNSRKAHIRIFNLFEGINLNKYNNQSGKAKKKSSYFKVNKKKIDKEKFMDANA